MRRIAERYPAAETLLFGSRARGDHRPDSDADLAVILEGEKGDRYKVSGDMAGIAFDVMLETGVLIQALPLWEDEFKEPERFSNPALIANIRRDGLRL
jgi:predicted nucleotidyltransferase